MVKFVIKKTQVLDLINLTHLQNEMLIYISFERRHLEAKILMDRSTKNKWTKSVNEGVNCKKNSNVNKS